MKIVIDAPKNGVAARKVQKTSPERLRNPAIKIFGDAPTKQEAYQENLSGVGEMGDWWDDITAAVSSTATKAWDSTLQAGQVAAVKAVQQSLVKIIGGDGKVKEVPAGSAEAVAYQNQQAVQYAAINNSDKTMTYMMYGMGALGVIIAGALIYKVVKK